MVFVRRHGCCKSKVCTDSTVKGKICIDMQLKEAILHVSTSIYLLELNLVLLVLQTGGTRDRPELLNLRKTQPSQGGTVLCVFNPEVHA